MSKKTLSIMPYYGGKARMAEFISEKLNYDCSTYVELFGGGCRVLLNKPRHKRELYVDMSEGLTALISVLSNKEEAKELIQKLYYETEYSQEYFKKAKEIFDICEMTLGEYIHKRQEEIYAKFLKDIGYIKGRKKVNVGQILTNIQSDDEVTKQIMKLSKEYDNHETLRKISKLDEFNPNLLEEYHANESMRDHGFDINDIDLGVATYITYAQSRDGMGKYWSNGKSDKRYKKGIENLILCAERLKGIQVLRNDATNMVGCLEELKNSIIDLNNRKNIMIYADPSYISPDEERKLLDGINYMDIDIENQRLSNIITKSPTNLGKVYVKSFEYKDHEEFLRYIYKSQSCIMVSNYDLILYNKYLNENTGWKKFEFETVTNVGNGKGRKRKEVIWLNY